MSRKIETSEYKLCKQCGETKPRTAEYFRVRNKKYFWSPCLVCLKITNTSKEFNKRRREKRRQESFFKIPRIITTNKPVAMYALLDVNGNPFYIGKSVMPVSRLKAHKKIFKNVYSMNILEWTTQELWPQREKFYIASFRSMGYEIVNISDGGAGPNGWHMPLEAVQRAWETRRKNGTDGWTKERKQAFIKSRTGYKCKSETKEKISKAHKGKPLSLEHRQKLKDAWKRRKINVTYDSYPDSIKEFGSIKNGR